LIKAVVHVIIVAMMAVKLYGLHFNGMPSATLVYETEVDKTHKGTRKDTPTFLIKFWRSKCLPLKQ
jgi:NO-binding membrane sensor protein with MHYT domain